MASSVFCLVLQGDGWSARMDDSVLHGCVSFNAPPTACRPRATSLRLPRTHCACRCIPVVILDDVHVSFESILDVSKFSLRVNSSDVERLPEILLAVTDEQRATMQRQLGAVWHRFSYSSWRPYARRIREIQAEHAKARRAQEDDAAPTASLPETVPDLDPFVDDAFHTIMAWLHSRIDATQ